MKDNILIAEFMGLYDEISLDSIAGNIHSWSDAPFFYITEDSKEKVMEGITKYSKYHESWDWLMPVHRKCMFTPQFVGDDQLRTLLIDAVIDADINRLYDAVVNFIQEYRLTPKEVV